MVGTRASRAIQGDTSKVLVMDLDLVTSKVDTVAHRRVGGKAALRRVATSSTPNRVAGSRVPDTGADINKVPHPNNTATTTAASSADTVTSNRSTNSKPRKSQAAWVSGPSRSQRVEG